MESVADRIQQRIKGSNRDRRAVRLLGIDRRRVMEFPISTAGVTLHFEQKRPCQLPSLMERSSCYVKRLGGSQERLRMFTLTSEQLATQ